MGARMQVETHMSKYKQVIETMQQEIDSLRPTLPRLRCAPC